MNEGLYDSCRKILKYAAFHKVDEHAEKRLRQAIESQLGESGKDDVALVKFKVNGKEYPYIYDAIDDVKELKETEIILSDFDSSSSWAFMVPTAGIKIMPDGVGWFVPIQQGAPGEVGDGKSGAAPVKAMFRLFVSKHFHPQSLKSELAIVEENTNVVPYGLVRIEQLWSSIRDDGTVPIMLRLCAYTQDNRYAYNIDLLRGRLLRDIREDKIPQVNRVERKGLLFFHLDKILTIKEIPDLSKKILEITFESKDIDLRDLADVLHVTEKTVKQFMNVLVNRGYIVVDGKPPNERFMANLEEMGKV